MANILIATLGESPIVVTSMAKVLIQQKNIQLDKVIVLYPEEHPNIKDGLALIETHCLCRQIEPCGLPFPDINTYSRCYAFLQTLYGLLETAKKTDNVWLSLAGGRKTMSALMYLFAPFYENIKGVYHILDRQEGTPQENFYSFEDLIRRYCKDDPKLEDIMNPPIDELKLVEIPFDHFANAEELRRILKADSDQPIAPASIRFDQLSDDARIFWERIFQQKGAAEFYEIMFSENAKDQFLRPQTNRQNFSRYFSFTKLKHPDWANKSDRKNGGKHASFDGKDRTKFYIAKIGDTAERIAWWFDQQKRQVVIAELGVEDHGEYHRVGAHAVLDNAYFVKKSTTDYKPICSLNALAPFKKAVLLAGVGTSPMVVTQAYTLLQKKENADIETVAVVFPDQSATVKRGVRILEEVFRKKTQGKVQINRYGVAIDDVDDTQKCHQFLNKIIEAIDDLKQKYPDAEIYLLLSGGRKGMSALAYFAAQRSRLESVWHTLITDLQLEDRIEQECSISELDKLGSAQKRTERLFLECYLKNFEIFEVPVIPFRIKD